MTDPLQLPLKDIHLPAGVSWWPPAPGWWLLATLLIVIPLLALLWHKRRVRNKYSAVTMARKELQALYAAYQHHQDSLQLVRAVSILLRRLSISASPREESAGLTGAQWLQYLDRYVQGTPFTTGPGRILVDAPYRPAINTGEVEPLISLCNDWITAVAGKSGSTSV